MKKLSSLIAAAACVGLLAGPALAQNAPSGSMGNKSGMSGMKMSKPMAKMGGMKMAAGKHTCMDYAWQSQDMKDCEAGKKAPPNWR